MKYPGNGSASSRRRWLLGFTGSVQGVGFRPTVYRLAVEAGLSGWVANTPQGVQAEIEGAETALRFFFDRFPEDCPPLARVTSVSVREVPCRQEEGFRIRGSESAGDISVEALPDAAVCPQCAAEVLDPANRRYRYPFTNCTHCGPRFSILLGLPYDRERTTMRSFAMCPACRAEYEDPSNRRFHAQPNACPVCGPRLSWWDASGKEVSSGDEALRAAVGRIRSGGVVAVKGLGGFQIVCRADDESAVRELRARKHREQKPLAVMFRSIEEVRLACRVGEGEALLLASPSAPIVLTAKGKDAATWAAPSVAPDNPNLGVFLPTTPLHLLLLTDVGAPLVVTSGNFTDEPMVTEEGEAVGRLRGVADGFLVHDRPIARAVDDSVARWMADRPVVLRRARGYAPRPIHLPGAGEGPAVLALGAHLKNSVTFLTGGRALVGQHIGDLETPRSLAAFAASASDLPGLYGKRPELAACDLHPDYASTRHAASLGLPLVRVQHHAAHLASCAAENGVTGEALGVAWDGTGWGEDGTVWGGEFFVGQGASWTRRGRLRPFRLPGGEAAVKEPRRAALGLLYEAFGEGAFDLDRLPTLQAFTREDLRVLRTALPKGMNAPWTSSMGRLFDAVASLLGLHQRLAFEGQGAMAVEFAAAGAGSRVYPLESGTRDGLWTLDWRGILDGILQDKDNQLDNSLISATFQNSLVEGVINALGVFGHNKVLLSGGCFQNKFLLELCVRRLRAAGVEVYWPREVPPNDGGISLGQAWIARNAVG